MEKIIIIKLGAKGDVVRTLPIAKALKSKYPNSQINWITKKSNSEFVKNCPYIDKVFVLPYKNKEKFDFLYNFDIEEDATSLAKSINADKKYGFYSEGGYASAFNFGAEYYLNTLFDDETKRTNKKTYQEMMFLACDLVYNNEPIEIVLTENCKKYADNFAKEHNLSTEKLIGIHIGSSPRWPSKAWPNNKIMEFIKKAKRENYELLLFGGPDDLQKQKKIIEDLEKEDIPIFRNFPDNTDMEFASLVNLCSFIVCSDSLALHVSLAMKKRTVCLFFCTSPDEVEGYGLLKKIVSPKLYDFFPERSDKYSKYLVNSISVEEVLKAVKSFG
jgi:ADP-heptose:LPS heptosyltransferase